MNIIAYNCIDECRRRIDQVIEFLSIDCEDTVKMNFGIDTEKLFGNECGEIYGAYIYMGNDNHKMFFEDEDVRTIDHEFSHLKFRKMYPDDSNLILDFIDEYLAKRTDLYIEPFFYKRKYISNLEIKNKVTYIKGILKDINGLLKNIIDKRTYMRQIAIMLVWREELIQMKEYDYNVEYNLLTGLSDFYECFKDVNHYNVMERYENIANIYDKYNSKRQYLI